MATLEENKIVWDGKYDWPQQGDEWSSPWGGPDMQWYGTILPRIYSMLPRTGHTLEIACGYGRWTNYLKDLCSRLTVVDLSQECINACKQRFDGQPITYHLNDGKSLEMIDDRSVDFVFSYDSLVHADQEVITAYLSQLARILTTDGVAFIHHSNLGQFKSEREALGATPQQLRDNVAAGKLDEDVHWRDPSVCAGFVEQVAHANGLKCISQEVFCWGTVAEIDCYSTIVPVASERSRENIVFQNDDHGIEVQRLKRIREIYCE